MLEYKIEQKMKKNLILIIILTLYTSLIGQKNFIDQPYIEVNGYADTLVTPNRIYIQIIISEKDSKNKISLEEQENQMIIALKNLGINIEENLKTENLLSKYQYYFLKQKDIIKTKVYNLMVSDAQLVGKVFQKLESIGISNAQIDRVEHSDIENIKNMCRIRAIKNSHKKAVDLTKAISQKIGKAIFITDDTKSSNLENRFAGQVAGVVIRGNSSLYGSRGYENKTIGFEKIKVSAILYVKYTLE